MADPDLANSGSFGIFSQLNARDRAPGNPAEVRVYSGSEDPFTATTTAPESPGQMCFPPIAACITGAARLMLAMAERCDTDLGGVWAFCDTDSLAIVATDDGRLVECPGGCEATDGDPAIRSLSYRQCADIRARFNALNPYDPQIVHDLLKSEAKALCLAVSAKRNALYHLTDNRPVLVGDKYSEAGLGHLMNPLDPDPHRENKKDWIGDYWVWRISRHHQIPVDDPPWLDRPAVGAHTISSPRLYEAFTRHNAGLDYADSVKPFSFMLVAFLSWRNDESHANTHLVAPYESDPRNWETQAWVDRNAPDTGPFQIRTRLNETEEADDRTLEVRTFHDVLDQHWRHPEPKYLAADGTACRSTTQGLLKRRPTLIAATKIIGKESNRLDTVGAGIELEDPTQTYCDTDIFALAAKVLRTVPTRDILHQLTGLPGAPAVTARTVQRFRQGAAPSENTRTALIRVAAAFAAQHLDQSHARAGTNRELDAMVHPEAILMEHQHLIGAPASRSCACGCERPVGGRARYASGSCRQRAKRHRLGRESDPASCPPSRSSCERRLAGLP